MSQDLLAPDYVKAFKCIADKCEDTCCHAWDVRYEKDSYELLFGKVKDEQQRTLFQSHIKLYKKDNRSSFHAYIKMQEDGYCPFLTSKKICQLQEAHGAEVLSNVCALYPRVVNQLGSTYEVNGALSCPEMVRICIRSGYPDNYFSRSDGSVFPQQSRLTIQRKLGGEAIKQDDYLKHFRTVRDAMHVIVSRDKSNLLMQLYELALYSSQLSGFYYSGCEAVRKSELTRILNQLNKDHDRARKYLNTIESDNEFSENFIVSLLQTNISQTNNKKYQTLVSGALAQRDKLYKQHDITSIFSLQDDQQAVLREVIDKVCGKYLLNCIYREWFSTLPNPFVYVFMITVRLAMIRFIAQLLLRTYIEENQIDLCVEDTGNDANIEKQLVEIVYLHARAVDHNMPYLQVVYQAIAEQDMFNMDFILPLIKCRT